MSKPEFPIRGTKCGDCECCLADVWSGDVPVCFACDEGIPCKGRQATPAVKVMERVEQSGAVVEKTQRKHGVKAARQLSRPLKMRASDRGYPLSDELKAKILAADKKIPHRKLALRLGTSDVTVRRIRLEAGIVTPTSQYNPRKNTMPAPGSANINPNVSSLREKFDRDEPDADLPEATAPQAASVVFVTRDGYEVSVDSQTRIDIPMGTETPFQGAEMREPGFLLVVPKADHYAAVIADLEETAVRLQSDLERITSALPLLRVLQERSTNAQL